jgi:hypothetical protein
MPHMELYLTPKGALYTADCDRCGASIYVHEWATPDNNADRDAMQAGTLGCPECAIGRADPETFHAHGRKHYAARYSANGYMDCTDWHYGTNKRELIREVRDMYGED